MNLALKDRIGIALVIVTATAAALHGRNGDPSSAAPVEAGVEGALASASAELPIAIINVGTQRSGGGAVQTGQVVLVDDGLVRSVGSDVVPPEGSRIIDGGGRFLGAVHPGARADLILLEVDPGYEPNLLPSRGTTPRGVSSDRPRPDDQPDPDLSPR